MTGAVEGLRKITVLGGMFSYCLYYIFYLMIWRAVTVESLGLKPCCV